MAKEIERKFLVDSIYDVINLYPLEDYKIYEIFQVYLSDEVRARIIVKENGRYKMDAYLTIKTTQSELTREEIEFEVPFSRVQDLMAEFPDRCIKKTRYVFDHEGKTWEVDSFHGPNTGLKIAEIELKSEDEEFKIPPGVGKEVTGDERYYNSYISKNPGNSGAIEAY